jgi:hypothetical protein
MHHTFDNEIYRRRDPVAAAAATTTMTRGGIQR